VTTTKCAEKRQGAGALQNLAEQLSSGERFASWSAVALYRFGTGREALNRDAIQRLTTIPSIRAVIVARCSFVLKGELREQRANRRT
jgi:hypothetical protein